MCNLFIAYYKFFILYSAKAYLEPFQTSMIDFSPTKSTVVVIGVTSRDGLKEYALWKNTFKL